MKARKAVLLLAVLIAIPFLAQGLLGQAPPPPDQPQQAPPPPPLPPYQPAPPPTYQPGPAPTYQPGQLDQLVARIALYPDPLLGQILAAATYGDQITDAAHWADEHHYLTGQALADAITADQLPWDPSVQALLPFPSVLDMMASDINWTYDLGNAFLASQQDVMDAVQRERKKAWDYGYLRTNGQIVVSNGPYITIMPANPGYIVVPYYDPAVVFFRPRTGFAVGLGIRFGYGVTIGGFFSPWGWGAGRFDWGGHALFIDNARWGRTWANRGVYVHPFPGVRRFAPGQRAPEAHQLIQRSERERSAAREGRRPVEEHGGGRDGRRR